MIGTVTFGADAGHLMNRLLESAGVEEIDDLAVRVLPEADSALLNLLREAADGGWLVRLSGDDGTEIDTLLRAVPPEGLFGSPVNSDGEPIGLPVLRTWRSVKRLHIY